MIGQKNNIQYIDNMKSIPHFIVLVGNKGSGKTTLAKYVADKLSATFAVVGIKVDEIREVITTAYKAKDKILYCVRNADTMRNEAKNAMLKITEEPPTNAWFIMTVEDDSSLLDTIKSRAIVIQMEDYTEKELLEYYLTNNDNAYADVNTLLAVARTPYEVDILVKYGVEFIEYVTLVLDNIGDVEPANAFKSSSRIAIKTEEGYDLKLFFQAMIQVIMNRIMLHSDSQPLMTLCHCLTCTCKHANKLKRLGVNKQHVYDAWVFDIREVMFL